MCVHALVFDQDEVLTATEEPKIRSYHDVLKEMLGDSAPPWVEYLDWHKAHLTGKSRQAVIEGILDRFGALIEPLLRSRRGLATQWTLSHFGSPDYEEGRGEIEKGLRTYRSFDNFPASLLLSIHRLIKYAQIPPEQKWKPITPVVQWLTSLQSEKFPTALVTESELKRTQQVLGQVGVNLDLFEIVACKDQIYRHGAESESPGDKARMYRLIAEEWGQRGLCVAIEDARTGMQAALAGGLPCFRPCQGRFDERVVSLLKALCFAHTAGPAGLGKRLLSVDFGGTQTKVGFGELLELSMPWSFDRQDEADIVSFLRWLCGPPHTFQALGIALASTLVPAKTPCGERERRISEHSTKFSRLSQVEGGRLTALEARWTQQLGIPVFILNDGEASAIAEHQRGAGQKYDHVMVLTLGTSIGVGFIFHGQPFLGPYTSRASHIILDPYGEWCHGESHAGCWKTMAGSDALRRLAEDMGLPGDPREVARKAREGDAKAQLCYELYAERVARGIATIVGAVPIECVVVGGGIAQAGDVLMQPLKKRLLRGDLLDPSVASALAIVPATCEAPVVLGSQLYAAIKIGSTDNPVG